MLPTLFILILQKEWNGKKNAFHHTWRKQHGMEIFMKFPDEAIAVCFKLDIFAIIKLLQGDALPSVLNWTFQHTLLKVFYH